MDWFVAAQPGFLRLEVDGLFLRLEVDGLFLRLEVDGLFLRLEIDGLFLRLEVDGLLVDFGLPQPGPPTLFPVVMGPLIPTLPWLIPPPDQPPWPPPPL